MLLLSPCHGIFVAMSEASLLEMKSNFEQPISDSPSELYLIHFFLVVSTVSMRYVYS